MRLSGITVASALWALAFIAPEEAHTAYQMSADFGETDPIPALAKLASRPRKDCNIFGGKDACKKLPLDSNFGKACAADRQDLWIDCVYYREAEKNMVTDPETAMASVLGADYARMKQHCRQCMNNLKAMWCVQVLPECGSFREVVHKAILPAALEMKKAEDAGKPRIAAVSAAVPGLLEHIMKTMACKEMCEATVNTCSCKSPGKGLTFGQALQAAEEFNAEFQQFHPEMSPADLKDTIFPGIWDMPLCDIFSSKDDPGFTGTCDNEVITRDKSCSNNSFCEGLDSKKKVIVEAVIAGQIAKSVFGIVSGPSGLSAHSDNFSKVASKTPGVPPISNIPPAPVATQATTSSSTHGSSTSSSSGGGSVSVSVSSSKAKRSRASSVATFFITAVCMTTLGVVGYFAWRRWNDSRVHQYVPSSYEPIQGDGIPMTAQP